MNRLDLNSLVDNAPLNRFHYGNLFWCAIVVVFDGYDLAVAGVALPSIMQDMRVSPASAGFMVSSALLGMMFGAVIFGMLADFFGRRWTIAASLLIFSSFTAAAGFTHDPTLFSVLRFVGGIGLGGVMPILVAQMTEYSPLRIRSTLVTLMFSGYSVGGMLAAVLGKALLLKYGWESVFIAAGLPAVLVPFVLRYMCESMSFLNRNGHVNELRKIAIAIEPTLRSADSYSFHLSEADKAERPGLATLFAEGRGVSTLLIWVTFFMGLFVVYALSSWLAKLMASAGYSLGSALTFVLVLNAGALVGAVSGGWLADRFNSKRVLVGMFVCAAISIFLLGFKLPHSLLLVTVFMAGASTIGTQMTAYAFAGQFYPAAVRGTGIGWASGVGRVGAILAPVIIGALVGMSLPLQQNFIAIAIPSAVAAIAMLCVNHNRRVEPSPFTSENAIEAGS
ncbi:MULTISPECIES: MFS transporter [Burkholderia cepacia complex]|uniref:MFS transporter n=1 Tax=Burkholderia cepacia complex TaxID=87882 RepID=UPI001CF5A652|nr:MULTISPECIES: aromatic acid/H+ symport family MFS transporter [Burkholderia cepacia complex]MCA8057388.1 aromatic acid/H+ symport family MFS transporter [Burkholderia cepacia]MDN7535213.1 aromatic acid/H+ symport family MFS transporter [Burkholderia orbicola]